MKNGFLLFAALGCSLALGSCKKDSKNDPAPVVANLTVDETKLVNKKWYEVNSAGKVWIKYNSTYKWESSADFYKGYNSTGNWDTNTDGTDTFLYVDYNTNSGSFKGTNEWILEQNDAYIKVARFYSGGKYSDIHEFKTTP